MEKRDYLESQIEQLGLVLKNIIGFLAGKQGSGLEEASQYANQALQEELGLNIDDLANLPHADFMEKLSGTGKFNNDNLETLADVLFEFAKLSGGNKNKAISLYKKALLLYKTAEGNDRNYSFERNRKMEAIIKKLDSQVYE